MNQNALHFRTEMLLKNNFMKFKKSHEFKSVKNRKLDLFYRWKKYFKRNIFYESALEKFEGRKSKKMIQFYFFKWNRQTQISKTRKIFISKILKLREEKIVETIFRRWYDKNRKRNIIYRNEHIASSFYTKGKLIHAWKHWVYSIAKEQKIAKSWRKVVFKIHIPKLFQIWRKKTAISNAVYNLLDRKNFSATKSPQSLINQHIAMFPLLSTTKKFFDVWKKQYKFSNKKHKKLNILEEKWNINKLKKIFRAWFRKTLKVGRQRKEFRHSVLQNNNITAKYFQIWISRKRGIQMLISKLLLLQRASLKFYFFKWKKHAFINIAADFYNQRLILRIFQLWASEFRKSRILTRLIIKIDKRQNKSKLGKFFKIWNSNLKLIKIKISRGISFNESLIRKICFKRWIKYLLHKQNLNVSAKNAYEIKSKKYFIAKWLYKIKENRLLVIVIKFNELAKNSSN